MQEIQIISKGLDIFSHNCILFGVPSVIAVMLSDYVGSNSSKKVNWQF